MCNKNHQCGNCSNHDKYVTITKEEYEELKRDQVALDTLYGLGLDHLEGYRDYL